MATRQANAAHPSAGQLEQPQRAPLARVRAGEHRDAQRRGQLPRSTPSTAAQLVRLRGPRALAYRQRVGDHPGGQDTARASLHLRNAFTTLATNSPEVDGPL
jgi:hypothetical protein